MALEKTASTAAVRSNSGEVAAQIAAHNKRLALAGFSRVVGRLSLPLATALLLGVAIAGALTVHSMLALIVGTPLKPEFFLSVVIVTVLVATPIIVYAQILIRSIARSHRVMRRMTERLAVALDEAERASQAKSSFVANMSHELRTPLNAIIGFSDVMRNEAFGVMANAKYLDYAKDINESGIELLELINEILDLSKIEASKMAPEKPAPFDLLPLLEKSVHVTETLAQRQGVSVIVQTPPDADQIMLVAVERMVRQILLNILSNAVKFTPAGGVVEVRAERGAVADVAIRVTDTGIGMTPEEIKIALTPFGQIDSPLSRAHAGTGLGLPLAKAMTELLGGHLSIKSTPGRGTTVSLTFPSSDTTARAPLAEPGVAAR